MNKHTQARIGRQVSGRQAAVLEQLCYQFLKPLLVELNGMVDRRIVQTFLGTVLAIVIHRHRHNGLLLSELGGYLLSVQQAPAGTKRISRMVHSEGWDHEVIEEYLWHKADERVTEVNKADEVALVVWDESVVEKAESLQLEGLGPVRSSKAARLKRIKPGYFNPPGGRPIFVPGMNWLAVLVLGQSGPPSLAAMRWWTTRGELATERRTVERDILAETSRRWGADVLHVWDRGFAGSPWLCLAYVHAVRFVMRWPKHYRLLNQQEQLQKAWQISRGKRSWAHRYLYDARRRCQRKVGVVALPVQDPTYEQPLWLVVARRGQGQEPWYLLTNEPVHTVEAAWRIVLAYARRWQVEMTLRYCKSELAFESPRLWRWHSRLKLLALAALAYAFLLSLLAPSLEPFRRWLLSTWCPRTGKRSRDVKAPLYRLRSALSRLWLTHPPPFLLLLNSG